MKGTEAKTSPPTLQNARAATDYDDVPKYDPTSKVQTTPGNKTVTFDELKASAEDNVGSGEVEFDAIVREISEVPYSKSALSARTVAAVEELSENALHAKSPVKFPTEFPDDIDMDGGDSDSVLDEADMREILKALQAQRAAARRRAGVKEDRMPERRAAEAIPVVKQANLISSWSEKDNHLDKAKKEKENAAAVHERGTRFDGKLFTLLLASAYFSLMCPDLSSLRPIEPKKTLSSAQKKFEKEPSLRDIANVCIRFR